MRVKYFRCEAVELLEIVKEAMAESEVDESIADVANDWVSIVLRNTKSLSVHMNDRVLSEKEHYDLLSDDILNFEDALLHTIQPIMKADELGTPMLRHEITDETLEFYYYRN